MTDNHVFVKPTFNPMIFVPLEYPEQEWEPGLYRDYGGLLSIVVGWYDAPLWGYIGSTREDFVNVTGDGVLSATIAGRVDGLDGILVVKSGIKSISDFGFKECRKLQKIVFPNTLISIGDGAFFRCTSLKEVLMPKSVKIIGEYAFQDLDALTIRYSGTAPGAPWGATNTTVVA